MGSESENVKVNMLTLGVIYTSLGLVSGYRTTCINLLIYYYHRQNIDTKYIVHTGKKETMKKSDICGIEISFLHNTSQKSWAKQMMRKI